jgi:D-lactate dehydrogenase (cytochrome)
MKGTTDPEIIIGYLTDASGMCGSASKLFRPTSTEEVAQIIRHCSETATPITVSAARTSTTGAPVPVGGAILNMEQMTDVEVVGQTHAIAMVGIKLGQLHAILAPHNLLFPPDPTSRDDATLGGAIATNASGARSYKYGATRPWIEALEVVWSDGQVTWVDRSTDWPIGWPKLTWRAPIGKNAAGYAPDTSLLETLIGSEGTLAVITRAKIRLIPRPKVTFSLVVPCEDTQSVLSLLPKLRQECPFPPSAIEYLDLRSAAIACSEGLPAPKGQHLILLEVSHSSREAPITWWSDALSQWMPNAEITVAITDREREVLRHARHAVPARFNEIAKNNGYKKLATDFAVPDHAFAQMMTAYEEAPVDSFLFGHLGQNHLHLNLLPRNEAEHATATAYLSTITDLAIALHGTISAEHGVGKIKRAAFSKMAGSDGVANHRALKQAADPKMILGIGTLFSATTV